MFETFITWLLIPALAWGSLWLIQPPPPAGLDAPLDAFSATRAMRHVRVIARRPHPTGSAANARVRRHIVQTLQSLSLHPRVKRHRMTLRRGSRHREVVIHNIVARLPGTVGERAVMLVAHYDSVPDAPGAGDDAAGVAAILETLRALRHRPPLRNDLIVLFTDGEELGLLGARAFVEHASRLDEIAVVLNFEARGVRGPSIMFETSRGSAWLVRHFARAASAPVGNSLTGAVYRRMPHLTDFTVFKEAGLEGLNFAFIGGAALYHTPGDTPPHLSLRSLQHHGVYALELADHFGRLNLAAVSTHQGEAVYFMLGGWIRVVYPQRWVIPLLIGLMLLFVGVITWGIRCGVIRGAGPIWGFAAAVPYLAAGPAAAALLMGILPLYFPYPDSIALLARQAHLYLLGLICVSVAIQSAVLVRVRRWIRPAHLQLGVLIWWLIPAALTSFALPGGSFLFLWPAMAGLIGFLPIFYPAPTKMAASARTGGVLLIAVVGMILLVPTIVLTATALTLRLVWIPLTAASLLIGLLTPHMHIMTRRAPWLLPTAATVGAVGFLTAGVVVGGG